MAVAEENQSSLKLDETILNAKRALNYCLCNQFTLAKSYSKDLDSQCMYHVISDSTISYLQAIFTYEQELIEIATKKVKKATEFCNGFRKRYTMGEMVSSWVGRTNFDEFSEVQLHAELCYAECLLQRALLTFIQDENLVNFIKGGLKIRSAYAIYRNCMVAVDQKAKSLSTSKNKKDFESGVYMGMGTFNVLLSLVPARVLRLLEWAGFGGDKRNGLLWLDRGLHIEGLRSSLCAITLLVYQVVVAPILGLVGDTDVEYVEKIVGGELEKFPDSSIFLYFSGRSKQTQGLIEEALEEYMKSVATNMDWHQVHHICYWEMLWCYSFLGKWDKAAEYAEILSTESKWSKTSYLYMHAAFLIMTQFELLHSEDKQQVEEGKQMKSKIDQIISTVKVHKQRIAGKSIPFEKFAVARVDKYQATGMLVLPGLEILHLWNCFTIFSNNTAMLEKFLDICNVQLDELKQKKDTSKEHHDNICLCMLLRGICLRHLKRTEEAEETLKAVADSPATSHSCKMDCYIPPYASAELSAMYWQNDEVEKALQQYEYTLSNYTKYGLESRLHFRIHGSMELIKERKRQAERGEGAATGGKRSSKTSDASEGDEEYFDVLDTFDDLSMGERKSTLGSTDDIEIISNTNSKGDKEGIHQSNPELTANVQVNATTSSSEGNLCKSDPVLNQNNQT